MNVGATIKRTVLGHARARTGWLTRPVSQGQESTTPTGRPAVVEPVSGAEGRVSPPRSDHRRARIAWTVVLRVAVSVALIYYLLQQVSLGEILAVLSRTLDHWLFLLIATALPLGGCFIGVFRWRILLGGIGAQPGVLILLRALLVGTFFNQFLPSTIGGDAARSWWIKHSLGSVTQSLTVVALDRLIGLVGFCAVGLVAAGLRPSLVRELPQFWIVVVVIAAIAGAVAALAHPAAAKVGRRLLSISVLEAARGKAALVYGGLAALGRAWDRLIIAFLLSMALQFAIVVEYFMLSMALGMEVSLWAFSVLIPIVTLISLLPVSVNGIGLREAALAVLGAPFGITVGDAVAMAWLFVFVHWLYAIFGGIIYLIGRGAAAGPPT